MAAASPNGQALQQVVGSSAGFVTPLLAATHHYSGLLLYAVAPPRWRYCTGYVGIGDHTSISTWRCPLMNGGNMRSYLLSTTLLPLNSERRK